MATTEASNIAHALLTRMHAGEGGGVGGAGVGGVGGWLTVPAQAPVRGVSGAREAFRKQVGGPVVLLIGSWATHTQHEQLLLAQQRSSHRERFTQWAIVRTLLVLGSDKSQW